MSIRAFAFLSLTCASLAIAAPPKSTHSKTDPTQTQPSTDAIDVDALARAKDGTEAATVDGATPSPGTTQDSGAVAPAPDASLAAPPVESTPEAPAVDTSAAATNAPVPVEAPTPATNSLPADTLAAPAMSEADAAAQSLAAGCQSRATSLLDEAAKADYTKVTRDFDAKMRSALPAPKFKEAWESLAQFGKLNARGQAHLGAGEGYTVVMIPLIFEKANLVAQIACGSDGRIAGFYVKPLGKSDVDPLAKPEF